MERELREVARSQVAGLETVQDDSREHDKGPQLLFDHLIASITSPMLTHTPRRSLIGFASLVSLISWH